MRNRVPDEATCAICGRQFDPSETRGWCPNPSCGEWQHPAFPVDETESDDEPSGESTASTGPSTPTKSCPNCGNEVRADANFCKHCAAQLSGDSDDTDEENDATAIECPDCGADLSQIPSDRLSQCPICMFDLGQMTDDTGTAGADTGTQSGPGTETNAGPGADADAGTGTDTGTGFGDETGTGVDTASGAGSTALADVDDIASGYVQRLSEVGVTTVGDLQRTDPDTLSAQTGISARRIRGWVEDTSDDSGTADDSGGGADPTTGADPGLSGLDGQTTRIQRSADDLVLDVMGQELTVTDGETVGREVRNAMVRAGAPEDEAVYVHRKHIRIEVDDEGFWLTRLGENSLTLNGRTVEKGDTVPIEDGDEVGFSNVVTATVTVR